MKWNGPQLDNQNSQNISVGMVLQPDDEVETNIVARPSDGSSRISFVEELDTLEVSKSELQYDNNDNNGNHDNGNGEELDQNEGEFPDERKEWMEARQSHASFDVILTEDEVDRIFDDVFATPDEKERQVTLSEIALTRSIRGHDIEDEVEEEMPLNGKSRRFRFVTYQKEMLGCLLLALIALAAWGVGRVQSNMDSYNEDTTGTHVVTLISPQNDSSLGFILAHKINRTSRSSQPPFDVNVDGIIRGNAKNSSDMKGEPALFETKEEVSELSTIPGKDIGEYLLGFVPQPIKAEEIRFLLNHALTRPLRVPCEDCPLDTSEAVSVTVDTYELMCGVQIDHVPLTTICVPNDLCGVYFVDASYCDKYE